MTKAHALIIDDNTENVEVLARLLGANGVTNTSIQDTNQLEDVLQGVQQVDVIFLDLEMPKRNGYELLDVLRSSFETEVPIVAYTVHINEIATAREVGFERVPGKTA